MLKVEKIEILFHLTYNCTPQTKLSQSFKMSTQFATNVQDRSNTSIYIPHVFPNFDKDYITGVFENMDIGKVSRVDLVSKTDRQGKAYNAAYIHFDYWYTCPAAANLHAKILDPKQEAKIMHQDPWFWICLENTAKKRVPGDRKPVINVAPGLPDEDEEEFVQEYEAKDKTSYWELPEAAEDHQNCTDHEKEEAENAHIVFLEQEYDILAAQNEMLHANIEELHAQISAIAKADSDLIEERDQANARALKMFGVMMNSTTPEQFEALRDNACLTLYHMTHKQYEEVIAQDCEKLNMSG